jgi:hypothetical protein
MNPFPNKKTKENSKMDNIYAEAKERIKALENLDKHLPEARALLLHILVFSTHIETI